MPRGGGNEARLSRWRGLWELQVANFSKDLPSSTWILPPARTRGSPSLAHSCHLTQLFPFPSQEELQNSALRTRSQAEELKQTPTASYVKSNVCWVYSIWLRWDLLFQIRKLNLRKFVHEIFHQKKKKRAKEKKNPDEHNFKAHTFSGKAWALENIIYFSQNSGFDLTQLYIY